MDRNNEKKNIKKVIKFYFAWHEEKEAQWLRDMSNRGWHLKSYSIFKYTFDKGEPKDYIYQFDFYKNLAKEEKEYLDLFSESGWTFITKYMGWYFFKKLFHENEQNKIYSDKESLKQKYDKLYKIFTISIIPLLSSLVLFIILSLIDSEMNNLFSFIKYFLITVGIIIVWWIYAFIRIILIRKK